MTPCTACGACCAASHVSFHESELEGRGGMVPEALADPETASAWRMRGTDAAPPRCAALTGDVGRAVRCGIYPWRPAPCRDFQPHGFMGRGNPGCSDARARHGLAPLPDPPPACPP